MNRFEMTGNISNMPKYGLNFLGYPNCGPAKEGFAAATVLDVSGNTFSAAYPLFKTNFPNNIWQ